MTVRRVGVVLVRLVVAMIAGSACVPSAHAQPVARAAAATVAYVRVIGADYMFEAPDAAPAGIITFNLINNGSDLHAMALFELPANHTVRDFLDQYHALGMIPTWMVAKGQTPTIASKAETFLTARLRPGRYILACLIPASDGRAHTEKGMVKLITVK